MGVDRAQACGCCTSDGAAPDACIKRQVQLGPELPPLAVGDWRSFLVSYPAPFAGPPWIVGLLNIAAGGRCGVSWFVANNNNNNFALIVANAGPDPLDLNGSFFYYQACPGIDNQTPENVIDSPCLPI